MSSTITMLTPNVPVLGTFLTRFDMKKGNTLIWSQNCDNFPQDSTLAFKSMPSGIHEEIKDTICFTVNNPSTRSLHFGIAAFKQNSFDLLDHLQSNPIDRDKVKMFSLGVILDININESVEYIVDQNMEYYMNKLHLVLKAWLLKNNLQDMSILKQFNEDHEDQSTLSKCVIRDPLEITFQSYVKDWVGRLGPLLFTIWKSTLLNERILILNLSNENVAKINSLCHMIKLISPTSLLNLFTIGISDLDNMKDILTSKSYIACTNDSLLEFKPEIYDKLIKIEPTIEGKPQILIMNNKNVLIKATPNDLELNSSLFQLLNIKDDISNNIITNYFSITEPLSWTQFFWDELYLFMTVGYFKPSYHNIKINLSQDTDNIKPDANILPFIIKIFQNKTKTLRNVLQTILLSKEFDELTDDTIYLHPHDLKTLQLDCFSTQDFEFVIKLSKEWFNKNVEISGLSDYLNIAC
ncbi:uncharacterized protein Anr2p [Monosporozyma unispora]|nr:hypothetical protein C6P44_005411 [Kazachstania unispora]